MATFQKISGDDVPAPTTNGAKINRERQLEYERYAVNVGAAEVGVLEPEQAETTRSLKSRITRAGTRSGVGVRSWAVDGKVYFTRAHDAEEA